MSAEEEIADIAIVGGGLTGLAQALALGLPAARTPLKVILIDPLEAMPPAVPDPRALAITHSSRRMFEAMGLWTRIAPFAAPLSEILVTDSNPGVSAHPVLLRMDERAAHDQPSCHFVEGHLLHSILADQVRLSPHVRIIGESFRSLEITQGLALVETREGRRIGTRLVIAADGKTSACRSALGIDVLEIDYRQMGIVTTITHDLPHRGQAHENFLPAGPFAVLPLSEKRSSIVWTEEEVAARRLMAASEEEFLQALRSRLGCHVGDIKLAGPRQAYPLSMTMAKSFIGRRAALIGDAAHVIHPLAGLGFNLGLRDIAALAEAVVHDIRLGLDIGSESCLERYQMRRRMDTVMTAFMVDVLNRLFSNEQGVLKVARDLGLMAVGLVPPAKAAFMREAAGLSGDLPKLLRGEPL
jgi:2-octaprenyl-6-methoxyphenol hydroxylase